MAAAPPIPLLPTALRLPTAAPGDPVPIPVYHGETSSFNAHKIQQNETLAALVALLARLTGLSGAAWWMIIMDHVACCSTNAVSAACGAHACMKQTTAARMHPRACGQQPEHNPQERDALLLATERMDACAD